MIIVDIRKIERIQIKSIIKDFMKTLTFPRDDFWVKGFIDESTCYLISEGNIVLGFFSLDSSNSLIEFFLYKKIVKDPEGIFEEIIVNYNIKSVYVESFNTDYLVLVTPYIKSTDIFFRIYEYVGPESFPTAKDSITVRTATEGDLDNVIDFQMENLESPNRKFIASYSKHWIDRKGVYLFYQNAKLIGTGELRVYRSLGRVAYLGVIVGKLHRKIGLGTRIIKTLTEISLANKLKPICSAEKSNRGSDQTLKNAGFYPSQRIFKFDI